MPLDDTKQQEIEITFADATRCNRLRGLSVRDCQCRRGDDGWDQCPEAAHLGILGPDVIRDCQKLAAYAPLVPQMVSAVKKLAADTAQLYPQPQMTGEVCREPDCGGFLVRTGTCMTCSSCSANDGCG
jgi:hypothetical protein